MNLPASPQLWLRDVEGPYQDWYNAAHQPNSLQPIEEAYFPPAFAHRADRHFFIHKAWNRKPALGYHTPHPKLIAHQNAHIFLTRTLEGTVFDSQGVKHNYGFLNVSNTLPPGVSKENGRESIDWPLLDNAPYLPGNFAIFYNGNLQNYYHWLIDGLLSLFMLRKLQPEGLKLLLPQNLAAVSSIQYLESLKLLGFGDMETVTSPAPIVQVETASWVQHGDTFEIIPAHILREFQAKTATSVQANPGNRIYIERGHLRNLENAAEVWAFLEPAGFKAFRLEQLSVADQVKLFAGADFIVSPHGAGLSNLIFAPPGARVIEFMPDMEMRPFFWMLSTKLGHEYGMIPCPSSDGGFNGRLKVDMGKLQRLFALLEKA